MMNDWEKQLDAYLKKALSQDVVHKWLKQNGFMVVMRDRTLGELTASDIRRGLDDWGERWR